MDKDTKISIEENSSENVIFEIMTILSQPQMRWQNGKMNYLTKIIK